MRAAMGTIRRLAYATSAVATLAVAAFGCGGHQDVEDDAAPEADPLAPTPLTVDNAHWLDCVVFVFHDGELSRVGTVTAASSTNFFLPNWMIGQSRNIRLLADP